MTPNSDSGWSTLSWGVTLTLYLVCVATVSGLLWQARREVLSDPGGIEARAQWEQWRAEAQRQARGEGPILRRAPQTSEPPGSILLRDHFVTAWGGMLLLTSALFVTLVLMVRGVWMGPRFQPEGEDEAENRNRMEA